MKTTFTQSFEFNRSWLEKHKDKYPHWSEAVPRYIDPLLIDALITKSVASVGWDQGWRVFAFKNANDLVKFRQLFGTLEQPKDSVKPTTWT